MHKNHIFLAALSVCGILAVGAVGFIVFNLTAERIVIAQSERASIAWANHIGMELRQIERIARGADITSDELRFLDSVRDLGDIFRFKIFDTKGQIRLISDDLNANLAEHPDRGEDNRKALRVVKTGQPYSELEDGTKKPDRPDIYAETYVPVYRDGRLVAVAEVYMDRTAESQAVKQDFLKFGWKIAGITILLFCIPGIALAYLTGQLRRQSTDLYLEQDRAHQQEALFSAVVDRSPTIIHITDLDGRITLINTGAEALFGFSNTEARGARAHDLLAKNIADAFVAHDRTVVKTGQSIEQEVTFDLPTGTRTFLTVKFPILDRGRMTGIGAIGTDITDRKHAEEERRKMTARFMDFADVSADWFWETDSDYKFTYVSPRVADLVKAPPEYLIGKSRLGYPGLLDSPDQYARHKADIDARRPIQDFEYEYVRPDKSRVFLSVNGKPVFDEAGKYAGYRGTTVDITARKLAAHAVQESEERLRGAIESLQEGFVLFDKNDRIIAVNEVYRGINPRAQEYLDKGLTFEDLIRANVKRGWMIDADDENEAFVRNRLEQHRNPGPPIVRQFSDGRFYLLRETRTPEGGIALTFVDISELKRVEEQLNNALAVAERANNAKSEFLAAMSHELRTPLNAIIGFSELIERQYFGTIGSAKYLEYAADIRTSSDHLLQLVNDILDLSAIEAGGVSLNKESVIIKDIVDDCSLFVGSDVEEKGIEFSIAIPDDLPPLRADRKAVKQILLNLLSNAVKFTPNDGKISFTAAASNGHHVFEISDSGVGVPSEKLSTLTDAFVRGETNPHLAHDGFGLGLTIAKSLVEIHEGELSIDSELGIGTTITVKLPGGELSPGL